jgi:hypothetical protein
MPLWIFKIVTRVLSPLALRYDWAWNIWRKL